jgi:hypothetical protein
MSETSKGCRVPEGHRYADGICIWCDAQELGADEVHVESQSERWRRVTREQNGGMSQTTEPARPICPICRECPCGPNHLVCDECLRDVREHSTTPPAYWSKQV